MGNRASVPPELPDYSSSLYNGKILEPLPAVNGEQIKKFDCGMWSDVVPDQLRLIIQQPERYREAIGIINTVSQTQVRFTSFWPLLLIAIGLTLLTLFSYIGIPLILHVPFWIDTLQPAHATTIVGIVFLTALKILLYYITLVRSENRRIVRELQKAIGLANSLLFEEKVLMGSRSNSKLLLVYVNVDGCRQELSALSQNSGLFRKAILDYSSAYTCCLAKRHFRFKPISDTGHLEGTMCFCQYVIRRLYRKNYCCYCCRKQYSYSALTSSGDDRPSLV